MKGRVLVFLCVVVLVGWGAVALAGSGTAGVPSVRLGSHQVIGLDHSAVTAVKALPEYQAVFGDAVPEAGTAAFVNFRGKTVLIATFMRGREIITFQQDSKGKPLSIVHAVIDGQTMRMKDLVSGETNDVDLTNTPHGDLSDKAAKSGDVGIQWSDYDRCYWMCVIGCFAQFGPWCGPMCALACLGA